MDAVMRCGAGRPIARGYATFDVYSSLLAYYLRFATSMDTTGSSQIRDERLRRRRERESRRNGRTKGTQIEAGRSGESGTELDALHKVRRGGRVHCSKCALPVVRDWHLRLLRRGRPDCTKVDRPTGI